MKKLELFKKNFICALVGENFRLYANAIRFAVGLHDTKSSIQLLNIKSPPEYKPEPETTTKFQVDREPVYSFTNMIPVMDDT